MLIFLICVNGIFSASELAFLSLDKVKLKSEVNNGNKKAIKIVAKEGKTYIYTYVLKQDKYIKQESTNFIDKLYNGSVKNMLVNFVKEERLSKEDINDLIKLIESEE